MGIGATEIKENPYVGPRAYEESEGALFFGRDEEIEILTGLVMARRAALFFAQSGAGKSSLLQAGLIPELTRQETISRGRRRRTYQKMRALPILTVGGGLPSGMHQPIANIYVFSALLALLPDAAPDDLASLSLANGLRPFFNQIADGQPLTRNTQYATRNTQLATQNSELSTLLIFDQFEHLFTYHPARWPEREDFFRQVSQALETYPELHVLFTMREDYIAELTPYTNLLPEQLRPRFRLERLQHEAALQAIRQPAARAGRPFAEGVAEALVENLCRIQPSQGRASFPSPLGYRTSLDLGAYIEPVHLQIVCRQLWANLPPGRATILAEDIQESGDVDQALISFYQDTLKRVAAQTQLSERRLRTWFDTRLITPARTRGLVYRGETETEGLPNAAIGILEDAYMIRADMRGGTTWYELAHDRLVEPILAANQAWRETYHNPLAAARQAWLEADQDPGKLLKGLQLEEAQAFAQNHPADVTEEEKEFLADSAHQASQAARRRRNTMIATASVMVVLALLTIWALQNAAQARRQESVAQAARAEAEQQAQLANSRELAAAAVTNLNVDPERGILLAMQSMAITYTTEAEDALHQAVQASRVQLTLSGHTAEVNDVAFSPDGTRLATASWDGTAKVWLIESNSSGSAAAGQELFTLSGHSDRVYAVAFSPDGKLLATAGQDRTVRVWDAASSLELLTLAGHTDKVVGVAFSPECVSRPEATEEECGTLLATASWDGTAKVWLLKHNTSGDSISGRELLTLKGHRNRVWAVAFSPDGMRLATASEDRTAKVWLLGPTGPEGPTSGQELLSLVGHSNALNDVAFSPDGARLATASWDGTARIWDSITGQPLFTLAGHTNWVRSLAFSPDGARLATASWDRTVKVWDVASGRELFTLTGHRGWIGSVAFSPECASSLEAPAELCGTHLATASEDKTAKLWNASFSQEFLTLAGNHKGVESVDFSPDGARLATAGSDGTVSLWEATLGQKLLTFSAHVARIRDMAFSPECASPPEAPAKWCETYLATAGEDRTAKVWLLPTTTNPSQGLSAVREVLTISGHQVPVLGVAFSPDGARLATASADKTARVWDIASGQELLTLAGHKNQVNSVAFSPDGRRLATASGDGTAKLWDAETGQELLTLAGHGDEVYNVAFGPDGTRLATASVDETVKIWDVASGQELLTLVGHTDRIQSVAFSPDGTKLATASWDGLVKVWNAATGQLLLTLSGHGDQVLDVAFSPDGRHLASASRDGTARLYILDNQELMALARRRLTRSLTIEECQRYLHQEACPPMRDIMLGRH